MPTTEIRTTRDQRVLNEWALVLSAADIPHSSWQAAGSHVLAVDVAVASQAVEALADYDRERRQRATPAWDSDAGSSNAAWIAASVLLIAHMFFSGDPYWQRNGSASAADIRSGELWRCFTALTLHADAGHVASNTLSTLLFLSPLSRLLGGGTAVALTVGGGALATLISGLSRSATYNGIGASTAVFAAVGMLGGLQIRAADTTPLWRRIRPLGAAVAILAMLGASPQTDVTAHTLGLLCGAGIGFAFAHLRNRPFASDTDRGIGIAAALSVAAAWLLASG